MFVSYFDKDEELYKDRVKKQIEAKEKNSKIDKERRDTSVEICSRDEGIREDGS